MGLQGKLRGETEWEELPNSTHPQADLNDILKAMIGHGFKVIENDAGWQIVNPLTKNVECEYRIW